MCQAGLNLVNHTAESGERASCCSVFCMHHLVRLSRGPIRPGATVPILQPRRPRLGRAKCLAQGHRQQVKGSLSVCD